MIVGFTQRTTTVSEDAGLSEDLYRVNIGVSTLRTTESELDISFLHLESISTATISSVVDITPTADAAFGFRDSPSQSLREFYRLAPGTSTISPLTAFIIDDLVPENDECFTIRINLVSNSPGERQPQATCSDDVNFFCEHTICILDNDSR